MDEWPSHLETSTNIVERSIAEENVKLNILILFVN